MRALAVKIDDKAESAEQQMCEYIWKPSGSALRKIALGESCPDRADKSGRGKKIGK